MTTRSLPSAELLRQLLDYDPLIGSLTWKMRTLELFPIDGGRPQDVLRRIWNTKYVGKKAGTINKNGYCDLHVFGNHIYAHRACWAIHYGSYPTQNIDHINGDSCDNRIANLRDVTVRQNAQNMRKNKLNKSGVTGVFWDSARAKWNSSIRHGGNINLGRFDTFEDAVNARKIAEIKYGFHPNHGTR